MSSLFNRVGTGARKAGFEAEKRKDILTLQNKMRPINGEMDKVYSQLGKAAFELYLAGSLEQPELAPIAGRLANLQSQITQIKQEIEDIRNKEFVETPAGQFGYLCPKGHGPLPPGNNFCTQCGAKPIYVPPPEPQTAVVATFCQNCGQPLSADTQFCAHCGHSVAQPHPPQPAPVATPDACAHCGEPLLPGAGFCAECGSPVAAPKAPMVAVAAMPPAADYEPSEDVLFPPETETGLEVAGLEEKMVETSAEEALDQQLPAPLEEEETISSVSEETVAIEDELSTVDSPEAVEWEVAGAEEEAADFDKMTADLPQAEEAETVDIEEEAVEQLESDVPEAEETIAAPIVAAKERVFCANCGEELLHDAIFCGECGHPVAEEVEISEEPAASSAPPDEAEIDFSDAPPMLMAEESSDQEEAGEPPVVAPAESTGFCANCGAVLLSEAVFCAECGQAVD